MHSNNVTPLMHNHMADCEFNPTFEYIMKINKKEGIRRKRH